MKLKHDQLALHLKQTFYPVYLLGGDEGLLVNEAAESIYTAAQKAGFEERIRFTVDENFDWSFFQHTSQTASLFSEKQYLELKLTSSTLSEAGKKIIQRYLDRLPPDKVLVILMGKLDANVQKTAWVKSVEKVGAIISIWPLSPSQIPIWINRRLQKFGFQADAAGVQLLALLTQGNLFATAQEIEKLSLLYPKGHLTLEQIQSSGNDSARYGVFDLIDAILQGQQTAVPRTLKGLEAEGIEPILVLWALVRELRQWISWIHRLESGQPLIQILNTPAIWEKRKPWITRTLKQHSSQSLYRCLQFSARLDRLIKGVELGSTWHELELLSLTMAGKALCPLQ